MANLNIKINAYFTAETKDKLTPEALWFTAHDAMKHLETIGIDKSTYRALMCGAYLYIRSNGALGNNSNILSELVLSENFTSTRTCGPCPYGDFGYCFAPCCFDERLHKKELSFIPQFKKVFEKAKEIYSKSPISQDKTQLYQFSEEDTLMLLEKVFGHQEYISFTNN